MASRPYKIRFTYLDARPPYSYALLPCKTNEALSQFRSIAKRLKQENENGVARIELKLGNRIIEHDMRLARPSRYHVAKEKDNNYFAIEGRPWAVVVPDSVRRIEHFKLQEQAVDRALKLNIEAGLATAPERQNFLRSEDA